MRRVFSSRYHFLAIVVIALFAMMSLPAAFGQGELGGRLRGTVVDQQGALIKGATATLTNPGTNLSRTATSNDAGEFVFVDVPAGTYKLTVAMTGFRTASYDNVTVNLNELRSINAKLAVGNTTEMVEVTGEAASVVSQETTLRNTVDERRLEELPLNGRDFANLVLYTPGVMRGAGGNGQGSGFNVEGARGTVNNFLIDGGDANDPEVPFGVATDVVANGLPIDAVSEFSVITSNGSAEFGRSSGGTVNVTTKSGS
ncbi:MAG TPA: carboxypeptidase regulatory-like domain-containing protein, partial [Terriglobales bacterium]|nr:carboxypeptidase regulatory-like domain-containing protein [Terriglobales bacterium]